MKNLFLIDSASGTGKSDLLRYLNEFAIEAKTKLLVDQLLKTKALEIALKTASEPGASANGGHQSGVGF